MNVEVRKRLIDNWNRVLTNIKIAENGVCSTIASGENGNPPGFPCIMVDQIDDSEAAGDLENEENAVESVVELQIYSSVNLTEARKIANVACDAMREMGYRRRMGPKQIHGTDQGFYRVVARFSRVIGDGEEIPKFNID